MKHLARTARGASVMNGDGHVIGIDLGATAVRAAVLQPATIDGRPTVSAHGLGAMPLPTGAVVAGAVVNGEAVTAALKQMWERYKFHCHKVVLGATSQQVMVRDFTVPHLSREQLKKTLPFQAKDVIALPLDQALLDFTPLGAPNESEGTVAGLLTGIPRAPVVKAVQAVEKAKLKVARVDLAPFGLLRSLGSAGAAIEALVDIGAHLTTIVIHTGGIAKVVRVVAHGGEAWTAYLADQADLPIDEAEATKRTIGLTGTNLASKLLRETIRPLVNEIRGSINFFAAQQRVTVQRIALSGGSAALPGLAAYLSEQLITAVEHAAPTRHVTGADGRQLDDLAGSFISPVAVGLAMGAAA